MKVERSQKPDAPAQENILRMDRGEAQADTHGTPDYNLLGQRLGRKGRDTRERILAATMRLLEEQKDTPISLSAVAREASLAMTTLYLYFSDLLELLLAVLDPVMAEAEEAYVGFLRERWPDETLNAHCIRFVSAYFRFWAANVAILQLRVSWRDSKTIRYLINANQAMIGLFVKQMGGDPVDKNTHAYAMATVLWTGLERLLTIAVEVNRPEMQEKGVSMNASNVLTAEARLLELGIRDGRTMTEPKDQSN